MKKFTLLYLVIIYLACGKSSHVWEKKLVSICEDKKITYQEFNEFREFFKQQRGHSPEKWCNGTGSIDTVAFAKYLTDQEGCILEWQHAPYNPKPREDSFTEIPMKKKGGIYLVPVKINGITLDFVFDTGASVISISNLEFELLLKNNTITETDITEYAQVKEASGRISKVRTINIKEVQIGNRTLQNVEAVVVPNPKADLLLGQTALSQFGRFEVDYKNEVIRLYDN